VLNCCTIFAIFWKKKEVKNNKNYMKEQFGEMVKIVKIHHLHKDLGKKK
jgi:hypothetical protein